MGSPLPEVPRLWKEGAVSAALCSVEAVYPTSVPFGGAELGWSWELGTRAHYAQLSWVELGVGDQGALRPAELGRVGSWGPGCITPS